MRVLLLTYHFDPENFKINDVAYDLSSKGHNVTVITGIPNYPHGRFYSGYGIFKRTREVKQGVRIIRLPLIPRGSASIYRLMLNYLSYLFVCSIYVLFHSFGNKYDSIFVHGLSPVFVAIPGIILKRIQKIPLYFWVLDLWPESMSAGSGFSNKYVLKTVDKIVYWIYRSCDKILVSSKGFISSILSKGNFSDKIEYLPNWAENCFENPQLVEVEKFPDGFNIVYAGNIGLAQDIELILKAAKLTMNTSINWIFIGDGQLKDIARKRCIEKKLDRVYFLGKKPIERMYSYLRQADATLLVLKKSEIFKLTVPARLQAYMACSKPVLGMISGEASSLIKEADCGYVCDASDYRELAKNAVKMSQCSHEYLYSLGINAHNYYMRNFRRNLILSKIELLIKNENNHEKIIGDN